MIIEQICNESQIKLVNTFQSNGKLDGKGLQDAASDAGERAEALFYEGLRVGRTDPEAGLAFMAEVLSTGMMSFFEYEMALNYLAWRELPVSARAPDSIAAPPQR